MRPITVTVGPIVAASANNIATSQSVGSATTVTLNGSLVSGGVATMDEPRRVLITSAADDSDITFTIVGTTFGGATVSEVLTGGASVAVYSDLDFATVTSITTSAATSGTITVGTNGIAGTAWVRFDEWSPGTVAIQANVSGTVNYTLQQTLDDPNSPTSPVSAADVTWVDSNDTGVVAATATKQSNYLFPPTFARIRLNSGTGSVTATFIQSGVVGT